MKLSLLAGIIALAVSLVMAFTLAAAAETSSSGGKPIKDRRWYVGGGIGAADDKDFNETDPGGKLFGGYRVSKFFSLEGAFV
ncbi:MAG: hypothetical protein ACE5LB_12920, partial [Acidiferrobacterales bacterium]